MLGSALFTTVVQPEKKHENSTMTAETSPFFASAASHLSPDDDSHSSDQEPLHEDISDGLQIFKKASSWLLPTYTRKDCRCGQCSIGDPEPCPYARPHLQGSLSSMLSTGRRSLSHLLSRSDQTMRAKET